MLTPEREAELRRGWMERDKAEIDRLRAENVALREAGERLYRHVRTEYEDEKAARSRWRELAGEPDPIIPGYGTMGP